LLVSSCLTTKNLLEFAKEGASVFIRGNCCCVWPARGQQNHERGKKLRVGEKGEISAGGKKHRSEGHLSGEEATFCGARWLVVVNVPGKALGKGKKMEGGKGFSGEPMHSCQD